MARLTISAGVVALTHLGEIYLVWAMTKLKGRVAVKGRIICGGLAMTLKTISFLVVGLVTTFSVAASPVHWTIDSESTTYEDKSIVTERLFGIFTYDTDTAAPTNVNLVVEDFGSGIDLFSYGFAQPHSTLGLYIVYFYESDPLTGDLTGESFVGIGFNTGGLLDFSNSLGTFPVSRFNTDSNFMVASARQECLASCFPATGTITL